MNDLTPPPSIPPLPQQSPVSVSAAPQSAVSRIVFYCKDCRKLVDAVKIGRKYVYKCPACHTKNVAFGTEKSIKSFYHVEAMPRVLPPTRPLAL